MNYSGNNISKPAYLLVAARELGGGQDMWDGSKAMEQHRGELDDQNEGKEEDKDQTNWLQLKVLLTNEHLEGAAGRKQVSSLALVLLLLLTLRNFLYNYFQLLLHLLNLGRTEIRFSFKKFIICNLREYSAIFETTGMSKN